MKKEDVQKALDNGEDIVMELDEHCIICWCRVEWDYCIVKIPEWVLFCLPYWHKHKDDKVYSWVDWWWGVYRVWFWFV